MASNGNGEAAQGEVQFHKREYSGCYAARDAYFACAEQHDRNVKAEACAEAGKAYVELCMGSWRKYWDDRFKRGLPIRGIQGR